MKKKFLSLMMAAAVVATTSVSAFAADQTITGSVDAEKDAQVKVEGKVANDAGQLPAGTYNVTIPSKVVFSVDRSGTFNGVDLPIVNNGDDAISVKVANFVDTDGNDRGIKLNTADDLSAKDVKRDKKRSEINLTLQGNEKKVFLGHELVLDGLNGTDAKTKEMASVNPHKTETLTLSGHAGGADLGQEAAAITNDFTLTFKISKKLQG